MYFELTQGDTPPSEMRGSDAHNKTGGGTEQKAAEKDLDKRYPSNGLVFAYKNTVRKRPDTGYIYAPSDTHAHRYMHINTHMNIYLST